MIPFDFHPRTRIVFGPGKLATLGELAGELGARRALVVSDPGIVAAGHTARAESRHCKRAGIDAQLFDDVGENPTTDHVDAGLAIAKRYEPELIVGLGGGSSMDCAKGINFLYTNGGEMHDYWGIGKATQPMLPMIAVPTTAGTGSETQSFALISDAKTHVKMACGDKKASFRVALLDPELTVTQPPRVTALTGIDAIAHALETYVARTRNPVSMAFSREAWLLLGENFCACARRTRRTGRPQRHAVGRLLRRPGDRELDARRTHALANPLTAEVWHRARPGDRPDAAARHSLQRRAVWQSVFRAAGMHRRRQRLPRARPRLPRPGRFRGRLVSQAGLIGPCANSTFHANAGITGRRRRQAVDRRVQSTPGRCRTIY